jgi:hypothetical protein
MWINITKNIFEKSDFKSLNFLYQILSWYPSGSSIRYNIVVDTENVKETANFKKLSSIESNLEDFLKLEYVNYVTSNSIPYKINSKKAENSFNIEEAILFFNQPVSIVLENNKNDSQFIRAIITHFGTIDGINKAAEHLSNGWLLFENAGGCKNIPNFMDEFLQRFRKIADKNNRPISDYFRGVIIIDSDKEFELQDSKHTILIAKLNRLGIENAQIHVLGKRMMENYLPKDVFQDIQNQRSAQQNTDLKEWLEVFLTLNDEQLDFINIADGFPPNGGKYDSNESRKPVEAEILTLFDLSLADVNFKKLDKGFKFKGFDENGNLETDGSFKKVFPNLFRKNIVNRQTLETRDCNGELQKIAEKINQLL